jgi:hypothetical protein
MDLISCSLLSEEFIPFWQYFLSTGTKLILSLGTEPLTPPPTNWPEVDIPTVALILLDWVGEAVAEFDELAVEFEIGAAKLRSPALVTNPFTAMQASRCEERFHRPCALLLLEIGRVIGVVVDVDVVVVVVE